jgi:hypothetical protein
MCGIPNPKLEIGIGSLPTWKMKKQEATRKSKSYMK